MGSDESCTCSANPCASFQSTLPGWGATCDRRSKRNHARHFNPRSPDGERLMYMFTIPCVIHISIHAPRMGSDYHRRPAHQAHRAISIHAPRMGSDRLATTIRCKKVRFQSTLPGWGATIGLAEAARADNISIHAPRMGSDARAAHGALLLLYFNPRSPDGERPRKWTSSPTIWAKSSIFNTDCIADRR